MKFKKLRDIDVAGKVVLIRQDLNVPIKDGRITSTKRIEASLATIRHVRDAGAKTLLMSHLGRPVEGRAEPGFSLQPVADDLSRRLGQTVRLNRDYLSVTPVLNDGDIELLENVRYNVGETANDPALGRQYARLCDVYVMDAFGAAHRAQASTYRVGQYAAESCAGLLLTAELEALDKAFAHPRRPILAIVGGAKVSTKLTLLQSLSRKVDQLIPGGGIANTLIAAAGHEIGKSLYEPDLLEQATLLMEMARNNGGEIPLPVDVVTTKTMSRESPVEVKKTGRIARDDLILDIGPDTAARWSRLILEAGTVIWNGPVGVFELPEFANGARTLGRAIADSDAFSICGGGDTLAAIEAFDLTGEMSCVSTGGGAFLEFLEGKTLPAVEMLESRANHSPAGESPHRISHTAASSTPPQGGSDAYSPLEGESNPLCGFGGGKAY